MKKNKKGSGGNMLLLAGLGLGAALLFAGKSNAQSKAAATASDEPGDIPDAPKILAVNTSATESPAPTGIVSDEDGMETVSNPAKNDSISEDGDNSAPDEMPVVKSANGKPVRSSHQSADEDDIPPLVSTKLTAKEKTIIEKGQLTPALAIKRPDLYKAAYIKRYGGKTASGKRKALIAASLAIDKAVKNAQAAKNGGLVKAIKYPAKPEYTFVQAAGGMSNQKALTHMAALHKAGVKVSPAAHKVAAQVKLMKGSKGKYSSKTVARDAKTNSVKKRVATKTAQRPKKTAAINKSIIKKYQ